MSPGIRVVVAAPESHVQGMAAHVRSLQAGGARILYLTTDRPYAVLVESFGQAGVDADAVFFVDAITCMDGTLPQERPANVIFLQSPTMLEMMAMRVEQMLGHVGPTAHVVVDSLSTLALYNGVPPVQEFSHYLANRLRTNGRPGDLVVRDNPAGRELHERVVGFTDEELRLAPEAKA